MSSLCNLLHPLEHILKKNSITKEDCTKFCRQTKRNSHSIQAPHGAQQCTDFLKPPL
jgi:hypothetical protein